MAEFDPQQFDPQHKKEHQGADVGLRPLRPGALWPQICDRTATALADGSLQPIDTHYCQIAQGGMTFVVRQLANIIRKQKAQAHQQKNKVNPFLPCDPRLLVADLSPTHRCLLNKYNVVDHHILLVTRTYESQEDWLTAADFEALALGLGEINGLGFYNGGAAAGASQPHKHLQVLPLPLIPDGEYALPLDALVKQANLSAPGTLDLPFAHQWAPLNLNWQQQSPQDIATHLVDQYRYLLNQLGITPETWRGPQTQAYNLVVTRRWMFIVPRRQNSYQGISVNSLGVVGSLLVRDQAQLEHLRQLGPMRVLEAVGF